MLKSIVLALSLSSVALAAADVPQRMERRQAELSSSAAGSTRTRSTRSRETQAAASSTSAAATTGAASQPTGTGKVAALPTNSL